MRFYVIATIPNLLIQLILRISWFDRVKKAFSYSILVLVFTSSLYAQKKEAYRIAFQDSIRVILETGQNTETSMVGGVFATAWHKLTLDQQELIRSQAEILRLK